MTTDNHCRPRVLLNPLSRMGVLGIGVLMLPGVVLAQSTSPTVTTTFSTKNVYNDVITPVTDEVDDYLTTVNAQLGNGTLVFSQTYPAPLSDPTVQAAITAADETLASDGQAFSAPTLGSSSTVLQSSNLVDVPGTPILTSSNAVTTLYFGPQTIHIGDNQSQTFTVLAGTDDYDSLTTYYYAVPISAVTTNTYLTTQSYLITGSVPEPATLPVLAIGTLGLLRRRIKMSVRPVGCHASRRVT